MNIVITGASRGFGRAVAEAFAAAGHSLLLSSRSELALYKTLQELLVQYPQAPIKAKAFDISHKTGAQQLGELAGTFALAGIDVIKDDHGIADQDYARFGQRVAAVQRAIERAAAQRDPGGRVLYAPTLSGGPRRLADQLRIVHEEGVGAVLMCPMISGVPTLVELVRSEAAVPILAHPAFAGNVRIAPALLLGRLFRLFGADATIFPNFGGRFSYDRDTCRAIARRAREPLGSVPAILPVPAGGMSIERVDEMIQEFGTDVMLLIGGNLLAAAGTTGDSVLARATAFVERVRRAATSLHPIGRLASPLRHE